MRKAAIMFASIITLVTVTGCSMIGAGLNRVETVSVFSSPSAELSDVDLSDEEVTIDNILYSIPAPQFSLPSDAGETVSLSDFSGDIVVLYFFSTWSKNCTESFAFLSQAAQDFAGVKFMAVSTGERRDMTLTENRQYIADTCREKGLDITMLFDTDNTVYDQQYYVRGSLPMIYIIDGSGTIRSIISGNITSYSDLAPYVTAVVQYLMDSADAAAETEAETDTETATEAEAEAETAAEAVSDR